MNMNGIKKYYIGLGIIGLIAVAAVILLAVKGSSVKQDKITNKRAGEISTALDNYIQDKNEIPDSLGDVGEKDVPDTIKYSKVSKEKYSICLSYKADSSTGYGGMGIYDLISGGAISKNQDTVEYQYSASGLGGDFGYHEETYFRPPYSHKKGENCQTIKPNISYSSYDDYYNYKPTYNNSPSSSGSGTVQQKARDTQRRTRINTIHAKLEEYYNENGFYPKTVDSSSAKIFPGIDDSSLFDPNGKAIVTDSTSRYTVPKSTEPNYVYVPSGCTGDKCDHYILKSYLETDPQGFTKNSLN